MLAVSPGLSSAELARRVGVTAQSNRQSVDDLVARNLVARRPHPTHGRVAELRITDDGLVLAEQAQDFVAAIEGELLLRLDDQERASVLALLSRIVKQANPNAFPYHRPKAHSFAVYGAHRTAGSAQAATITIVLPSGSAMMAWLPQAVVSGSCSKCTPAARRRA